MSNDFDAAVAATLQPNTAQAARVGFATAIDTNPDAYAEAQRVARRTGVPVDTVLNLPTEMKRQDAVGSIDFDSLAKSSPATASLLSDVEKAKVVHDDVGGLSGLESALYTLGKYEVRGARALASSIPAFNQGLWGIAQGGADLLSKFVTGPLTGTVLPEDIGARMAEAFGKQRQIAQSVAKAWMPQAEGIVEAGVYSGLQSLGQNLMMLPAAIATGQPGVALAPMVASTGGQAYGQARDKDRTIPEALSFAASQAAIEYATEKIPMAWLLKDLKAGAPFWKMLGRQAIGEVPGEQAATALQDMNEWAVINPEKSFNEYWRERPSAAAQTLIATLVGVGGQVSVLKGIDTVMNVAAGREQQAQQAELGAEALARLTEFAAASKVLQRDPETFEQFVAKAAEDSPVERVFIDAQTLMQSGIADQVAALSPAVAEQLVPAAEIGGQIAIPVEEYAARIAPTEYAQGLLDHLKTDPDGFSRAEAQQYMQSGAQELQVEVERALAEKQGDDAFKESAEVVRGEIKTQLDTAARFTPQVNDAYAAMVGNFYSVMSAKLGMSPQELYAQYPLRVSAEGIAGGLTFSQMGDVALDMRSPLSMQPDEVRRALRNEIKRLRAEAWNNPEYIGDPDRADERFTGQQLVDRITERLASGDEARAYLSALGVSYPVPEAPKQKQAKGSKKSKVADEEAVLYQSKQQTARGSFDPSNLLITLLKNADLSTFLHESGHFFLEVQTGIAAQLQKEAQIFGIETLNEGERQVLSDMDALLGWFGVKSLTDWHALDFEEKRSYHEQFARGFEAYLFEGKAPSIELQTLFQRFRAWMLAVYRELKNLRVELNDEVRAVFDRMLATNDQIALSEKARSMMPLFTSPGQAGMTPEEFAAYQTLGADATNEAVQDLQARGLRDMQWMHNARGRAIKQLQKQAAEKRAQVQMEVRREVMSQPIYQAWQFLTRKISADDRIEPIASTRSDPDSVDPTSDSLFAAIAKLGGISRESAESELGVHKDDHQASSGIFGKPVFRKEGGRTADTMAGALAELGYMPLDEHGKHDLRDLEAMVDMELGGSPQYSSAYDYSRNSDVRPGDQVANPAALNAGRFDRAALATLGLPDSIVARLESQRMVRKDGLHPDIVGELFGFTSGDELVRKLAEAAPPKEEIEALTDVRMLEQFGELSTPEAIERAADSAIHNDVRARMLATEANALAKALSQREATGRTDKNGRPITRPILPAAAKEFARVMISRLKVRDIRPGQYANAEARAAKAADKASAAGDLVQAAAEKRNQLINLYATRAAYDTQDEVSRGVEYLKKFDSDSARRSLDVDYLDQIHALLERFDLRKGQSLKAIDKRAALADWITAQRDAGLEPDIPAELANEAFRKSYRDMTVEEFRGLLDTVKQIEHLGKLKHRLLTAADQRAYEAVRDEIAASIEQHAQDRTADTRTPTTNMGRAAQSLKRFWSSHIKVATWARVMDGGNDGGPVWEYFVRNANERGDMETTMRAEATTRLSEILAPVFALGKMGGNGQFFASIGRSLNREARLAIALNVGNEGNLQRLLGGENWNVQQVMPVLQSLTAQEWQAVQAVWDHFESYRPQIAAKERRVYGKEPEWVAPTPFTVTTADGQTINMRGGYYPIKYDPAASQRAEEHDEGEAARRQMQGAYTTATTRRSFTKSRAEEVQGRPLLYSLAGVYSGVNDVIHDLAWHEWLIDVNKLLRSKTIDSAIRGHYGPEVKQQFKSWVADIAEGDKGANNAGEAAVAWLRQGVSAAGLGFNVMSAIIQPLGITQSIVRVGAPWVGAGIARYIANPIDLAKEINGKSDFMANRARTRFRELNELRNRVQDQSTFKELTGRYAYFLMMRCQQLVDMPTWWGAYEKAIAAGNDEDRSVALADQAVIDAQGGGQTKDLSSIERGNPALKLFTVFYSFMNTALNLGAAHTMAADTPAKKAKLAADYALLYVVPAVLGYFLKNALTPGDSGDDDFEKIAKKLIANQIDYLMGLMVVVREFTGAVKTVGGVEEFGRGYSGPAGARVVSDGFALATQVNQGEFDDSFRKAVVNVIGSTFGLPAAQANRTITGAQALVEGKTANPAAIVFGYQEPR